MFGLPKWLLVIVGAVLAYLAYRYWQYKKATAYVPNVTRLKDSDFTGPVLSPRDNPTGGN